MICNVHLLYLCKKHEALRGTVNSLVLGDHCMAMCSNGLAMTMSGPGHLAELKSGPICTESQLDPICALLEASLVPNGEVQRRVLNSMQQLRKQPGFLAALSKIFVELESKSIHVRQSAGIYLKNLLKQNGQEGCQIDQEEERILCIQVMKALGNSVKILRHTAGSVLACLMRRRLDPAVLEALWQHLHVDSADLVEGSLWALALTSEDLLAQGCYVDEAFVQLSCTKILPRAIELTDPKLPAWLRKQSSDLLTQFLVQGAFDPEKWANGQQLQGRFLESLGSLAMSEEADLMQNACKGFCSVIEQRWAALSSDHVQMILSFMLRAGEHSDEDVRREALAVWRVTSEASALHPVLKQSLPELTGVLLKNLLYGSADMLAMDARALDNDNANEPDTLEEIQPQFHKEGGFSAEEKPTAGTGPQVPQGTQVGCFLSEEWTARRAAADALDAIAGPMGTHPEACLQMLPLIEAKLQNPCWKQQEAGINALGCIGGSIQQVAPQFLQSVVRLLMERLSAAQPLVRSASCLSLTVYLPGVIYLASDLLPSVLAVIQQRCHDRNKHVQGTAMDCLTIILQVGLQVGPVAPFIGDICKTLLTCVTLYKVKNLRKLYHCIGVAVEAAPHLFSDGPGPSVLVPVFQRFMAVQSGDPTAMALFESMALIVRHLASLLAEALPRIVDKAVQVINETAYALQIWKQNPDEYEIPDQDLMAAAVDLLASAVDGLQSGAVNLLKQNNFLCILPLALGACSPRARQSGFWLLGSAAAHCTPQVQPLLPRMLDQIVAGLLQPATLPVNWSASWALGELCQRVDPMSLEPVIPQIGEAFVGIFQRRICIDVPPSQLPAHRQLLSATCFTLTCLKHTSSLGDKWPSLKLRIAQDTLMHLQSQYGFCD